MNEVMNEDIAQINGMGRKVYLYFFYMAFHQCFGITKKNLHLH